MSRHNQGLIGYILLSLIAVFIASNGLGTWYWFFGLSILYLSILIYASLNIDFNYYLTSFNSGTNTDRCIALTFDDGPAGEYTELVLDILKERQVKATFFCIGKKINHKEAIVKRIHQEGHIVGNHSFSHSVHLDFIPAGYVEKDLNKTNDLIEKIIGLRPALFRPPFGVTTPAMARALRRMKMKCIGWDNRSFDTSSFKDDLLLSRIKKKLKPGNIILLHDTLSRQETLLPGILDLIESESLQVVPLDQLLNIKAYE